MKAWQRWAVVLLGVGVLAALPAAVSALPVADRDVSAAQLLDAVKQSRTVTYSGYAEATGGLLLPVTSEFTDLVNLFGEQSRMRVWWRGSGDWRVDAIAATGETDLFHRSDATVVWNYESDTATLSADPRVRLPRAADLLPSTLGQRLLNEATAAEVTRLPPLRVAGIEALGLRLTPSDPRTTVDRVDSWIDPGSGLPLRVEVYGGGVGAVTSTFQQLNIGMPAEATTSFVTPPGATFQVTDVVDVADAADQFAPAVAPDVLAGLSRRTDGAVQGALGEYGRGVTVVAAVPILDRLARPLRDQLMGTPGATVDRDGVSVAVGPIAVLLTPDRRGQHSWLVAGTVDRPTLAAAGVELAGIPAEHR